MPESAEKTFDWTAQLVSLRDLTKRFESLHEAQLLQLKLWPWTVDPSLGKSEASVDFESKLVTFTWLNSSMKIDKKYQERLTTLSDNVRFLLGDNWFVRVVREGALIFPLDTNVKPNNRSRSRRKIKQVRTKRKLKRTSKKGRR